VAPIQDIGSGGLAGFEDDRLFTLGQQMRRGSEANRSRADDGDRKGRIEVEGNSHDQSFLVLRLIVNHRSLTMFDTHDTTLGVPDLH
jgi:hypothetical protein